jgi:hypothetical protein
MVVGGRYVFISYRRQLSWQLARLVRTDLVEHDFDIFMDLTNLDSGVFEPTILRQIETREHFIVLLEPGSLDRIGEDGDWLRREIAHALAHDRNVVPVTASGFKFSRDLVLPPDVARLPSFNGVAVATPEYFNAAMKLLRTRFLKMPPKPAAPPRPVTRSDQQAQATRPSAPTRPGNLPTARLALPAPQLTGHVNGLKLQLTWSKVPEADEYVLERVEKLSVALEESHELYRGPDRSYNQVLGRLDSNARRSGWRYRVCASAFGQAGKWSNTLKLQPSILRVNGRPFYTIRE